MISSTSSGRGTNFSGLLSTALIMVRLPLLAISLAAARALSRIASSSTTVRSTMPISAATSDWSRCRKTSATRRRPPRWRAAEPRRRPGRPPPAPRPQRAAASGDAAVAASAAARDWDRRAARTARPRSRTAQACAERRAPDRGHCMPAACGAGSLADERRFALRP